MPLRLLTFFLLGGCFLFFAPRVIAAEPDPVKRDTDTLRAAGVGSDGPALVEYFKKRTVNETDRKRIDLLIHELGDEDFDTREKATGALVTIGAPATPQLKAAMKDDDVEVWRRADICLKQIEHVASPAVLCAAARLLAHHKPDGAAEALLAYLPSAEDPVVADEVIATLAVVGFKGGKPAAELLKSLDDKNTMRRAAAADALWRGGDADVRKDVRKLLDDADVRVRLRLAMAMFDTKDKTSMPVLIDLLAEVPREDVWRIEEVLYRVAGDKAPEGASGGNEAARKKYRDQWAAWWKENGKSIDLAKLDDGPRQLGFTLLTEMNVTGSAGRVVELDQAGKTRWSIDNLRYPIDAQILPGGDKVLIAEYTGRSVTERNLKGEVLWTKNVTAILLGARRLANGNTFITTRSQLLEFDKDGKEVATINRSNDIASAVKLRNGDIGVITSSGQYLRLDAKGKELKSFPVGQILAIGGHFEVLPNGHVLVPQYSGGRVVEFDANGKEVWSANLTQPTCVTRLPNGHTLVGSRYGRYLVELDRGGKEVSRITPEGRPMQIERR